MKKVLLVGAGYSARAFAAMAKPLGVDVAGTTRSEEKFDRLRAAGIRPIAFDGRTMSDELKRALDEATDLVISASPDDDGDPLIAAAGDLLRRGMPALEWIGYLSTIGVYGNHDGAWVTEESECRPRAGRLDFRLSAERQWQDLASARKTPLAILRLSGIYGPGRNALVNLANGTARRIIKPGQIFNRIHVADIAGALMHLAPGRTAGVFNVTDDEPSPPQDVIEFAANLMNVPPPPALDFATADLSPMARSFYGENKRVSNAKLKAAGYGFAHPNYRSAFAAMWADGSWR